MASKRSGVRKILSLFILFSFFGWAAWFVASNYKDFKQIVQVPFFNLIALYVIYALGLYLSGLYTKYVMDAYGLHLSGFECFILSIGTSAANFILFFRGGAGVRAVYLKARYSFSFTDFLSSLSVLYLMQIGVSSLLGLIGMGMLASDGLKFDFPLAIFLGAAFIICGAAMFSGVRLKEYRRFPFKQISGVVNGWAAIKKQPRLLFAFSMIMFFYFLIVAIQSKIAFNAYNTNLSWGAVIFYSAGQIPLSYASITPGALGIQEAFTIYMGRSLHYSTTEALMVQGLIRFVSITTLGITGPMALVWMTRHAKKMAVKTHP